MKPSTGFGPTHRLKGLAALAEELNAASDRVTDELRKLQAELVALNLGVDVTLPFALDGPELPDSAGPQDGVENHYLAFGRRGRSWALLARLIRKTVFDEDYLEELPLLEAPRDLRIEAKGQIEDLLKLISTEAKQKIASLNGTIGEVSEVEEPESQIDAGRHGARAYAHADGVVLVKQTIKRMRGGSARYVIDGDRERFVDPGNDAALGAAVRAAVEGRL